MQIQNQRLTYKVWAWGTFGDAKQRDSDLICISGNLINVRQPKTIGVVSHCSARQRKCAVFFCLKIRYHSLHYVNCDKFQWVHKQLSPAITHSWIFVREFRHRFEIQDGEFSMDVATQHMICSKSVKIDINFIKFMIWINLDVPYLELLQNVAKLCSFLLMHASASIKSSLAFEHLATQSILITATSSNSYGKTHVLSDRVRFTETIKQLEFWMVSWWTTCNLLERMNKSSRIVQPNCSAPYAAFFGWRSQQKTIKSRRNYRNQASRDGNTGHDLSIIDTFTVPCPSNGWRDVISS